jgi:hypothetical protein
MWQRRGGEEAEVDFRSKRAGISRLSQYMRLDLMPGITAACNMDCNVSPSDIFRWRRRPAGNDGIHILDSASHIGGLSTPTDPDFESLSDLTFRPLPISIHSFCTTALSVLYMIYPQNKCPRKNKVFGLQLTCSRAGPIQSARRGSLCDL